MGCRLQGKIAWVTGAGSGIGESAALKLAEEGAVVVLTGRRREPLEAVAGRIRAAFGTAEWQRGLERMRQVRELTSMPRVLDEYEALLRRLATRAE